MGIIFSEDGTRKTYAQRRAERRQQDAERRAQTDEPITRDPIYNLPADERRRLRRAEEQGREEAKHLIAIEEREKMQAAIDATPEHLRRPKNIYHSLCAAHEQAAYRPDVAARIKRYRKLAAEREREIDLEMADKLRKYEAANNPETKPARNHWEKASAGAESEEEKREWARLHFLIEGGAANRYWSEVAPIMQARLHKMQKSWDEQIGKQAAIVGETKAMANELAQVEVLQVKPAESDNGDVEPRIRGN